MTNIRLILGDMYFDFLGALYRLMISKFISTFINCIANINLIDCPLIYHCSGVSESKCEFSIYISPATGLVGGKLSCGVSTRVHVKQKQKFPISCNITNVTLTSISSDPYSLM